MKKTILLAAGTTLMFGCSTINTDIISRPDIVDSKLTLSAEANEINVPAWVSIGSGVFQPDNKGGSEAFFGVGKTKPMEPAEQIQLIADDDARNNLAQILGDFNEGLIKYHQSVKRSSEPGWISEEKLQTAINDTAVTLLLQTEVVDNWDHPTTGEGFSLAQIDFKTVQEALAANADLSDGEQESVRFISKWVFENMKLLKERKLLFGKVSRAMTDE